MEISSLSFKTWSKYFSLVWNGDKTFEVRKLTTHLEVGDHILLRETENGTVGEEAIFTGRKLRCEVTYILSHDEFPAGLKEGYYVIGVKVTKRYND